METCSKQGCEAISQIEVNKNSGYPSYYCLPCFRTFKMLEGTYKKNKERPDFWVLRQMLWDNRLCPECGKIMYWAPSKTNKGDTVSLQHYEDGTIGVLCHSCNTSDGLKKGQLRGFLRKEV